MVTLLATDAVMEQPAEASADAAPATLSRSAGRAFVAVSLLLFRGLVLTGRGIVFTGRVTAGLFASTFDAAVTTAGARDDDGRPLNIWPPKLG